MTVIGTPPSDAVLAEALALFREELGISNVNDANVMWAFEPGAQESPAADPETDAGAIHADNSVRKTNFRLQPICFIDPGPQQSIFDSLSEFFASTAHLSDNIKSMYDTVVGYSLEEQVQKAQAHKARLEEDLAQIMTQQLVLAKRQSQLGRYISENVKKVRETGHTRPTVRFSLRPVQSTQDRNPTVDDLVIIEDDRLALLESRLARLQVKVTEQIKVVELFLEQTAHNQAAEKNQSQSDPSATQA